MCSWSDLVWVVTRRGKLLEKDWWPFILVDRLFLVRIIYYFWPLSHPTLVCFFPVGLLLLIQHFQQVLWVLKFLLSPDLGSWQLKFTSLIIVIVGFQNFVCCLVWAVYLGVQITHQCTNFSPHQWFELKLSTAQARRQKKLQHPQDLLKM